MRASRVYVYRPRPIIIFSQICSINIKKKKEKSRNTCLYAYTSFTSFSLSFSLTIVNLAANASRTNAHPFPLSSFLISVYSSNHSKEEERISTMPSGCKHHWLVLSMIDRKRMTFAVSFLVHPCSLPDRARTVNNVLTTNVLPEKKSFARFLSSFPFTGRLLLYV